MYFVRSSLVFGLLTRRTWPLALMVSTNQVPFRISNSKRSGQSTGCLGFRADNFSITSLVLQSLVSIPCCFVSLFSNSPHFVGFIMGEHGPDHSCGLVGHRNCSQPAWLARQDICKPRVVLLWLCPDRSNAGRHAQNQ